MAKGWRSRWRLAYGDEIAPGRSVIRQLGEGRRSEGYLVWDEQIGAAAVAKIVRPLLAQDEAALARLEREAGILGGLGHPCFTRVFDVALSSPRPHILVEHADGPSLFRQAKDVGLHWSEVVLMGARLAGALHYLAGMERVHYDVKPGNIVLSSPPKLIDFGASRTFEKAAVLRHPRRSLYKAPEQCEPGVRGTEGAPVDVWGLGISMYQGLTRRSRTFPRSHPGGVARQIAHEPIPLPEEIPEPLREVVLGCLRKHPDDRLTAAQVVEGLQPLMVSVLEAPAGRPEPAAIP